MSIFNELHRESAEIARQCRNLIGVLDRTADNCERVDREFEALRSQLGCSSLCPPQTVPQLPSASDRLADAFHLIGETRPSICLVGGQWRITTVITGRLETGRGGSIGAAFGDLWSRLDGTVDKEVFTKAERLVAGI